MRESQKDGETCLGLGSFGYSSRWLLETKAMLLFLQDFITKAEKFKIYFT